MLKNSLRLLCVLPALKPPIVSESREENMKLFKSGSDTLPTRIKDHAQYDGCQNDGVNRREFLAMATTFGATTATAYAMLGLNAPVLASENPKPGGTIRIGMVVRAGKDPPVLRRQSASQHKPGLA